MKKVHEERYLEDFNFTEIRCWVQTDLNIFRF